MKREIGVHTTPAISKLLLFAGRISVGCNHFLIEV